MKKIVNYLIVYVFLVCGVLQNDVSSMLAELEVSLKTLADRLSLIQEFTEEEINQAKEELSNPASIEALFFDAFRENNLKKIKLWIEAGGTEWKLSQDHYTLKKGYNFLHLVMMSQVNMQANGDTLKFLISTGIDVNAKSDEFWTTPLHIAIMKKQPLSVVKLLIDNKADVNAVTIDGLTPMFFAAAIRGSRKEVIKLLSDSGANLRLKSNAQVNMITGDYQNYSPLHIALLTNNGQVIRVLIGTLIIDDLVLKDGQGRTILDIAHQECSESDFPEYSEECLTFQILYKKAKKLKLKDDILGKYAPLYEQQISTESYQREKARRRRRKNK